jgi:hypothetical protein
VIALRTAVVAAGALTTATLAGAVMLHSSVFGLYLRYGDSIIWLDQIPRAAGRLGYFFVRGFLRGSGVL